MSYAIKSSCRTSNSKHIEAEFTALHKLDHPNIIKLYESYEDEECVHFVMEHCKGGDMSSAMHHMEKPFEEKRVILIIHQLLSAIQHMHAHDIVHRDIKCENILFKSNNQNDLSIKICDFGLSRHLKTGMNSMGSKKLHEVVGSPYYMAPEIIEKKYGYQCDIWAAGIVMYFLLSGTFPFSGSCFSTILAHIKSHTIQFETIAWSRISDLSKDLILKMLNKNPVIRLSADLALKHPLFHKISEEY